MDRKKPIDEERITLVSAISIKSIGFFLAITKWPQMSPAGT